MTDTNSSPISNSPRGAGNAGDRSAGWVRLGPWWVSRAGLDAVAARLRARRLLTDSIVYVVLHKTYHRSQSPAQIAAWFDRQFPDLDLLADEGFIRYVLAAADHPGHPVRSDHQQPEPGQPDGETGGRR